MNYTKGTWTAHKSPLGDWVISTEDTLIAREVRHFNAHLIAAAPDMYAACVGAVKWWAKYQGSFYPPEFTAIVKALAKVEGKV